MTYFETAKERYGDVDVERALETLRSIPISMHCWQGDDVGGFETGGAALSGGIQVTGGYPGRARTPDELMSDMDKAFSLIPGKHRINLHASYAVTNGVPVERDGLTPEHFKAWTDYAKERGLGIDFNPTFFSHPMAKDGLTLSHPDDSVRSFWVRHGKCCRRIAANFARELNTHSVCNIWIPDGYKDTPADRLTPRLRLKQSLDGIFAEKLYGVTDSVESKVFGIGLESYTVGSSEFYISYAAKRGDVYPLLDNGHFHPTESVCDKIPALLAFFGKIPLHVTRAVRWDSDHVVMFDDELREIAAEIVRNGAVSRVLIGLDYFDASINRAAAWVTGMRNMQKALLYALLQPWDKFRALQESGDFTALTVLREERKTYPFGAVWEEFCERGGVPSDERWLDEVRGYEREVLSRRI